MNNLFDIINSCVPYIYIFNKIEIVKQSLYFARFLKGIFIDDIISALQLSLF